MYKLALILILAIALEARSEEPSVPPAAKKDDVAETECKMCRREVPALGSITETKWQEPAARKKAWSKVYELTNQDGKKLKLDDLTDKPIALTFIYTRCDNPNKCPLAAATFAKLQTEVRDAGIEKNVRLLVMTYDPEYDLPDVLSRYAIEKKIACNDNVMLVKPDASMKKDLFEDLNVTVNYNANRVNIHGLQMILLDKQARYVRSYHTLIWDNAKVLDDLKKLVAE